MKISLHATAANTTVTALQNGPGIGNFQSARKVFPLFLLVKKIIVLNYAYNYNIKISIQYKLYMYMYLHVQISSDEIPCIQTRINNMVCTWPL